MNNLYGFKRFLVTILALINLSIILITITFFKINIPELATFITAIMGITIAYLTGQSITDFKSKKEGQNGQ